MTLFHSTKSVCCLILFLISLSASGQLTAQPPFESEILAFEAQDRATPPPASPIVFTGSSSIRLWPDLATYFPDKVVLNRGFGGSQLSDVIRYVDRVIVRYQPKQVVVYAGENDIAAGQTAEQTFERLKTLFTSVRQKLPDVPFTFISIKPSPSRRKFFSVVDEANQLIKTYLAGQKNTDFVDIRPVMLQPNGQPVGSLFKADSLHMNETGYQRWTPVLKPYLR